MYIKQTYSVLRNDVPDDPLPAAPSAASTSTSAAAATSAAQEKKDAKKKPRKWHLSAPPSLPSARVCACAAVC